MTDIEGEKVVDAPQNLPAKVSESPHQVEIFNPLEAEPLVFANQLARRQENYDQLALFMRNMLVPGKDFGRIHHVSKDECPQWWDCSFEKEPRHWSDYGLWAPGADKVLAMLGLEATYPGYEDYIRAAVTGRQVTDIIIKCHVLATAKCKIAEGMGASTLSEHKGKLNNALKIACKRSRVDAVMRLPGMSALFEDDFLAAVAAQAAKASGNSTTARTQQVDPKHDTGARLAVFPLGGNLDGQRFDEMEDSALDWCLRTFKTSKPDIYAAALREREARENVEPGPASSAPRTPKRPVGSTPDWLAEYDREQAFENAKLEDDDV